MILQGNQRGGARNLAAHLLKDENDHVEIHELRGFVSPDLPSALNEAYALSRGTKAKQFLFSLSLNPPPDQRVETVAFEEAVDRVEKKLGLDNQPRAVVFHEKEGRRHAHAVWSRIDAKAMKAIQLSHTKRKLMDISKELYLEHGWQMPRGFVQETERSLENFTLAQWQQAKRTQQSPKEIKAAFAESWAVSDGRESFERALKDKGYILARGDRRGFVAVDLQGEVYSVSKWAGIRSKETRVKLGDPKDLPGVAESKNQLVNQVSNRLQRLQAERAYKIGERQKLIEEKRKDLIEEQQRLRADFIWRQETRAQNEARTRQERFRKGLLGLFDAISGKRREIKKQNEAEFLEAQNRDQKERDALIFEQLEARRSLGARSDRLEQFKERKKQEISADITRFKETMMANRENSRFRASERSRD